MARRVALKFERGGELEAVLTPEVSPHTVDAFLAMLPLEVTVYHSRWSGREINFPVRSLVPVPRENQTTQVSVGDLIYWREWELEPGRAAEAIALYYGAADTCTALCFCRAGEVLAFLGEHSTVF